ncbi:hypothetical protein RQM59_02955 [Flavobacteriaceae bacterium S356]|uniref:Adhesin domain-containing protein n=1 Tax=Asprobacillus argus TaxID=3076534 RepID=A0ABU3LC61_9FLAO|nr:hypothetical protein [Flavobacteriaceae bacterium S356]
MKQFIYSILFVFSIHGAFSQTQELVLKDNFETDENTMLNIDIDNVTIEFQESPNSKIYLDYRIVFKKDAEDVIYKVFKDIDAKVSKDKNMVKLEVKNSAFLRELYSLDINPTMIDLDRFKKLMKDYMKMRKENQFIYKSKEALLSEIEFSLGSDLNDYFKRLKKKYPNKNFGKSGRKFKQKFIIKVPKNLKIKIKALHSIITFHYDIDRPIEVSSFLTYLKFKKINNAENKFNLTNGLFQSKEIIGGIYNLKDLRKTAIGSISNAKIGAETSKIQIGEIGENVEFNDFNSNIYFYNFSNQFNQFKYTGDYSKLFFYNVKASNYSMNVYGHNTTLNMNNKKTTFGVSKEKKRTKILDKKAKNNNSSGNIELEVKNGILNILPIKKG